MTNEIDRIDVTRLAEYTNKIQEIDGINKMLAPSYLRDFINAMDITSSMLSKAIKINLENQSRLKTVLKK